MFSHRDLKSHLQACAAGARSSEATELNAAAAAAAAKTLVFRNNTIICGPWYKASPKALAIRDFQAVITPAIQQATPRER